MVNAKPDHEPINDKKIDGSNPEFQVDGKAALSTLPELVKSFHQSWSEISNIWSPKNSLFSSLIKIDDSTIIAIPITKKR